MNASWNMLGFRCENMKFEIQLCIHMIYPSVLSNFQTHIQTIIKSSMLCVVIRKVWQFRSENVVYGTVLPLQCIIASSPFRVVRSRFLSY